MYDKEITSRLGHGLQMKQLKLGRRMNRPILGDSLGEGQLLTSSRLRSRLHRLHRRKRMYDQIYDRDQEITPRLGHGLRIRQWKPGRRMSQRPRAVAVTGPICGGARYSPARRRASGGALVVRGSKDEVKEAGSNNLE